MKKRYLYLFLIIILGVFLRLPGIKFGLPYFYDEDEAHHFNRTMNMVRSGDFNPHYFLKPSLHFYLRIPAISLGFLNEVKKGRAREVRDIITKDNYGIAGYAFTASHQGIVKWARATTLLFGILLIVLTFNIVFYLTENSLASIFSALLVSISPALTQSSTIVGVDTITAFFALLTVHEAIRVLNFSKPFQNIILSTKSFVYISAIAGLTISTKYNAFPIAFVPLLMAFFYSPRSKIIINLLFIITTIVVTFVLGTPYLLKEFPLFLNHIAYEIWHYGIAGHVGHEGTPGLPQALHYLKWLITSGIGLLSILLALYGVISSYFCKTSTVNANQNSSKSKLLLLISYPAIFFLYMIMQKANFERNMISIIPFVACLCGLGIFEFIKHINNRYQTTENKNLIFAGFTIILLTIQPLVKTLENYREVLNTTDSRDVAEDYIKSQIATGKKVAIAGELQFAPQLYRQAGVETFSEKIEPFKKDEFLAKITKGGINVIVSKAGLGFNFLKKFEGESESQRITRNPVIIVEEVH